METNSMTVEQIREEVCEYLTGIGPSEYPSETQMEEFADEFVAAHKREIAGLVSNLDALERAIEAVCDKETVEKIVAKKKEIQNGNE